MQTKKIHQSLVMSALLGSAAGLPPQVAIAQESGETSAGTVVLQPLVVSGERVARTIQDTAASVSVFDDERLTEQAGADRVDQVLDWAPNVQRGAHDTGVTIRGQDTTGVLVGANAFLGGTRPRATLQLDGRALNFNEFIYGMNSLWDVEQIEVFRGPQTTTQGRNAIAGAIFVDTRDPTFEREGAAQVVLGDYGTRQGSFALSGPLGGDELAGRIAVDVREHESWMNYSAPDVFVGASREDDNYATARAKLLYAPTAVPDLEVMLTYSHLDASNPQGETADEPYEDRIKVMQNGAHWDTDVDSLVLNADYGIADAWELSLTGTYADSRSERFAAPGFGTAEVEADEYSMEGLVRFDPTGGRTRGLFGISYFAADQEETSDLSAFLGFGDFTDEQRSLGIFGELTYDVTSSLHFTAGGRLQDDSQDREGTLGPVALDYDETFDEFLPKVDFAYDVSDEVVVGASARKGFNPGGTTVSFTTGDVDEFDAETLWSYELYSRAVLADGDLILTGNLFHTDFTNAQRSLINVVNVPGVGPTESTEFANAPKAESNGFEIESLWRANPMLQVRASLGYLQTEITETLLPDDPILGKEFARAPEFTAEIGLRIRPVEPLTVDIGMRHNSSYFSDDANTEAFKVDGVTIFDLKASYDFGVVQAFAFVRNVTDETYRLWQFQEGNSSLGDPREFGIGIEATF